MPLAASSSEVINFFFTRPLRGWRGWLVYLVMVALIIPSYLYLGGQLVRQTNLDVMASDQLANIWLARESKEDFFPLRSSYIQPLWPWVSTFVMDDDDEAYFFRGKQLNLLIGAVASVLIFIIGAAAVAPVPGYMMGLVAGFGVFLQRCHFFHPEPLLYIAFAGAVAGMVLSLRWNTWWFYVGWGICIGFGYLAKASVSPLLAVYAGATLILVLARAGWMPKWVVSAAPEAASWSLPRHLAGSVGALVLCAVIVAPNAFYKQRVHDNPFFSPTQYWMWCDDWDTEAYPLHQRIWTAKARAEFPPGELPNMGNYLRTHGLTHAVERLAKGVGETAGNFVLPGRRLVPAFFVFSQKGNKDRGEPERVWRFVMPARGLYVAALALVAAYLFIERFRRNGSPLYRTTAGFASCAYIIAMAMVFTLAFGWYAVIGTGERFSLTLYVPLMASLTCAGALMARASTRRLPRFVFATGICVVLCHAIIQIFRLILLPQFSKNFW
ncbi:MAG: hypothetical protein RIQ71_425 [Verrucomicrobiota bacterium]|jgi:hypothetical protein